MSFLHQGSPLACVNLILPGYQGGVRITEWKRVDSGKSTQGMITGEPVPEPTFWLPLGPGVLWEGKKLEPSLASVVILSLGLAVKVSCLTLIKLFTLNLCSLP